MTNLLSLFQECTCLKAESIEAAYWSIMKPDRLSDRTPAETDELRLVSLQDQELWKNFRLGDLASYAVIYRKYFFVLFGYGKKICQDEEVVKDCVQDLFIKIWNNRETLSETSSIKYYLFSALKNKLLDHLRSNHHKYESVLSVIDEKTIDQLAVPDLHDDFRKEKILKAINTLSAYQQNLIRLKFSEERSNKEIADELGITIQSVYNSVFKTLRVIRKQMLFVLITFLGYW